MATTYPTPGTWYLETASGRRFEIIDVDERQGSIEIRFDDDDLLELDAEGWSHLSAERVPSHNQSSSAFDEALDSAFSDNLGNDSFGAVDDLL